MENLTKQDASRKNEFDLLSAERFFPSSVSGCHESNSQNYAENVDLQDSCD